MSKTYCNEAWRTVHFNEGGKLGPCCTFRGGRPDELETFQDYWNSEWLQKIRYKMQNGIQVDGCFNCYKKEARGEGSQRTEKNAKYGYIDEPELKEIHMTFGNICNKTCNICRPQRSQLITKEYRKVPEDNYWLQSKWNSGTAYRMAMANKLSPSAYDKIDNYKEALLAVDLIDIDGGEPTITKQYDDLIDYMIGNGLTDKHIKISTNGSFTEKQLTKLDNFKKVSLHLSIDGIGKLYSAVRPPHDWSWWNEHHDRILKHKNIHRTYACVAHVFNVHQLPAIVEYFHRHKGEFYFSTLNAHSHLGVDLVPKHIISEVILRIESFNLPLTKQQSRNLTNLVNHLYKMMDVDEEENRKQFRAWYDVMPSIKNLDFQSFIPWDLGRI